RNDLALVPMPQQVRLRDGAFRISPDTRIGPAEGPMRESAQAVQRAIADRLGLTLETFPTAVRRAISLASPQSSAGATWPGDQAYRLVVRRDGIRMEATSPRGFFYAAQTLCQLADEKLRVRAAVVRDWPAIENRLVMVAVSQGAFQVIDVEYWKRLIRHLAAAKINMLMPYFEGGTFYYQKYPFLGLKGRDGFTAQKARILSEYARERFIELVPQQEALGHAGNILAHEQLAHLRESGGVFCSSKLEVFAFLGDLFDELVAAFPDSTYIHVGGDEFTHGFAKCPLCKARADEIGLPGLYAEHMNRLHDMLQERGRKMMIWWHEGGFTESAADQLPNDIVVFDWHYGNQRSYPSLRRLQQAGFANTWATPAVTRFYDRGRNDWDNTFGNIRGFLKAAARADVPGECTCTWVHGVWGGRNLFELNYYGLLYSAECAWSPDASDPADFRWKFARIWFGLSGDDLEQEVLHAVHAPFGSIEEQGFWRDSRALEPILAESPADTAARIRESPELVEEAERLKGLCARAVAILKDWRKRLPTNEVTITYLEHDVHIHQAAAERILAIVDAYEKARALPADQRAQVMQPVVARLRRLVDDYNEIEDTFRKSVHAAGGGECGWGPWFPYVASGRVQFRAAQG
ncbi:MAG: beta-N-acetylhexosaminidase, partial [Armatimonadota bacterium]